MIGMGWALTVAGSASSVLSYWKVDSASSKDFMIAFYKRMAGTPRPAALREAALEMMRSPGHRHPFYWAPFAYWGS
jgi:CHAT domain-containing protein